MDIDARGFLQIAAASIPALVTLVGLSRGPGSMRARLKHDIEMLKDLPTGTAPHDKLLEHITTEIDQLASYDTSARRAWIDFTLALIFTIGLGALFIFLVTSGHWYLWLLSVAVSTLAFATLSIMFEAAQKVPRDAKGKKLNA